MSRLGDWFDDRTGYRRLLSAALDEEVPGGASFAYVFGSVLTFVLVLQLVTGVLLALYYSPSVSAAWASVAYLQSSVTFGWFIRGLHHYGASAMIILAGLHLAQTALYGAYKKPREMNWIVGVLMLGIVCAFALTGYLLPWDQTGYWATKVATGIAGTTPVIGPQLKQFAQAGNEYGNLTLTHFFVLHVFVLPASLILLVVIHIGLFRRHGVTPGWKKSEKELASRSAAFWPDQMFRDMVVIALAFAAIVFVTIHTHGAHLDAPADPTSNFDARPAWYFRPLYQLLKYFHGNTEKYVALGTPAVVGGFLLALPFLDRGARRDPKRRAGFLAVIAFGFIAAGSLTAISFSSDAHDPALQKRLAKEEHNADKAMKLAREHGVPPAGGTAVFMTDPTYVAHALFKRHCASCHEGKDHSAPLLGPGYNSRAWIRAYLRNPDGPRFFGPTKIHKMKPVDLKGKDFDAIVELVYSQTGAADANKALAQQGQKLFDNGNCSDCHDIDWKTEGDEGPNLGRRGSVKMLTQFIANPGHPRWFGDKNHMPKFGGKLTEKQRQLLANYIVSFRTEKPKKHRSAGK